MMTLDVPFIINQAGGPSGLRALLAEHSNAVPNYGAIQMWSHRGTIPFRWLGLVLYVMARHGVSLDELLCDDEELAGAD